MRLEARRSAMLLMLPPVIALFWFDTYRTAMSQPPFWALRSLTVEMHAVIDFAPLVAAAAAWTGFRDHRRRVTDVVSTTPWPRWAARLTSWAERLSASPSSPGSSTAAARAWRRPHRLSWLPSPASASSRPPRRAS